MQLRKIFAHGVELGKVTIHVLVHPIELRINGSEFFQGLASSFALQVSEALRCPYEGSIVLRLTSKGIILK